MPSTVPSIIDGLEFTDVHVLVTGAATGLGRHIALEFGAADAVVSVLDITETQQNEQRSVVDEIKEDGGKAAFIQADLTDETQVRNGISKAIDQFGEVEVLVNNAGINRLGSVNEIQIEEWDRIFAVNLRGAFLTARFCLPSLLKTNGTVINVASTAGLHGSPNYAAYGPSKSGLLNLTRQLAVDFSQNGVRVNAVAPGVIEAGMAIEELSDPDIRQRKREKTLLPRFGTPQDVANAVLFLASDAASFITGETVVVDGGWCA